MNAFCFFSSSFFSRHGGGGRSWWGRVTKNCHLIIRASRPKAKRKGGGGGKGRRRESFQKICTYHVSVSRSRLGTKWGFSIMDKLLIRWELGLFLCPPIPPLPQLPSIHPSIPPSFPSTATPLVCFPSKMCLIFPDWTATSEMPK